MIGLRVGLVVGPRVGVAVGVSEDQINQGGVATTTALTIAISDSADPVTVSTNFTYSVVVTNVGTITATNVSAVVVLDASLTFVSGIGTDWDTNAVGQTVTSTRDELAVGAAQAIVITVTAGASPTTTSTTANADASNSPPAAQDTETTAIQAAQTTLTVALADSVDPVTVSTNFDYTAIVTNTGAVDATTVEAVVTLDASLAFVSGSGTGWTVDDVGQVVTSTRATLAVGAAPTITITTTAGATPLTASSTATADAANSPAATPDTETTVIEAAAGTTLTVAITDSLDPVISAVNFTYAVIVTNTGAITATTVSAVVTLDASLTFVSGVGTGWGVGHSAGVVTCTRATLAVGAAPTITITVTSADAASTETTTADADADNSPPATQDVETTVVKLVARDATSLIRVPASATQWTDFNAYHVAIGTANFPNVAPSSMYLMQEASGNLADSIGSITLTATGASLTYAQAVSGWTRVAFTLPEGLTSHNAQNTTTAVDISATSAMWLMYVRMPASGPAAVRRIARINSAGITALLAATVKLQCGTGGAGGSTVSGTATPTGATRPIVIQADRSGTPRARVFSDQEEIVGTVGTYSTIALGVGSSGGASMDGGYLYAPLFTGAAAEVSKPGVKALLQALGWSIAW